MAKRFNLTLTQDLYNELQAVANRRSITISHVLRQSIKLLLLAIKIEESPTSRLLVEEDGVIREIVPII